MEKTMETPRWFAPVQRHEYVPDPMLMGDCAICGNVRDSAAHALPHPAHRRRDVMDDLMKRLNALASDCAHTDGWEAAAVDVRAAMARIGELDRGLNSVLDREAATTARYDARIAELEAENRTARALIAELEGEQARADALHVERDGLLTTWAESRERHLAAEARADRLAAMLKEAEEVVRLALPHIEMIERGLGSANGPLIAGERARALLARVEAREVSHG
jgi:chromosome segregation ATPase